MTTIAAMMKIKTVESCAAPVPVVSVEEISETGSGVTPIGPQLLRDRW